MVLRVKAEWGREDLHLYVLAAASQSSGSLTYTRPAGTIIDWGWWDERERESGTQDATAVIKVRQRCAVTLNEGMKSLDLNSEG